MADTTYYAQFDGDEVDGKRYALGEPMAESVDDATLQYLAGIGRIATAPPTVSTVVPGDLAVEDMTRAQLEAAALATIDLSRHSDDDLRGRIAAHRAGPQADDEDEDEEGEEGKENGATSDDTTPPPAPPPAPPPPPPPADTTVSQVSNAEYDAIKGRALKDLSTAQLKLIAQHENIDLAGADTNAERVAAIQAARAS